MRDETGVNEPIPGVDENEVPLLGWVNRALGGVCAALLAALVGVMILQIFMRYAVEDPFVWVDEVIRILMVWLTFGGATLAYRTKSHIAINSLETSAFTRRRPTWGKALALFLDIVVLIGSLALLIGGVIILFQTSGQTTPALQLPIGVLFAPAPLCGGIVLCSAVGRWILSGSKRSDS